MLLACKPNPPSGKGSPEEDSPGGSQGSSASWFSVLSPTERAQSAWLGVYQSVTSVLEPTCLSLGPDTKQSETVGLFTEIPHPVSKGKFKC